MLEEFFSPENVVVDVEAGSWEDAIRATGRVLVENGCVEPRFVDAMVRVAREMGPYIVIAPGIALPHARPEEGVKRGAVALARLKTPVNFGSSINDPVDIVIALAPKDSASHIQTLASIADFLREPSRVAELRAAASGREVFDLIAGSHLQS